MKKILITVSSILVGATGAYAQGSLNWQDSQSGTYLIEILSPSTATPNVEQTGNTGYDEPSGNVTYTGGYIGGSSVGGAAGNGANSGPTPTSGANGVNYQNAGNFTMGLYVDQSPSALTTDILTGSPVATTSLLGGANDGLYNTAAPTYVSGLAPGVNVYVGLAAWYNGNGSLSYSTSVSDFGVQGYVESATPVGLGGGAAAPAGLTGLGLTSFSLATTTPEPSTIALGVIGASSFLMRLRRKK